MDSTQLTDHVRAAFGTACHLESLDRLAGGARKQIYRARLRDPSLGVLVYGRHVPAPLRDHGRPTTGKRQTRGM